MPIDYKGPELVIGLVAPIGCNIDQVQKAFSENLRLLRYNSISIQLSDGIISLLESRIDSKRLSTTHTLEQKIDGGNEVCLSYGRNEILAAWGIKEIHARRLNRRNEQQYDLLATSTSPTAYIVRQLKRPEEIDLLRKTYGNRFIVVSVVEDKSQREKNLTQRLRRENPGWNSQKAEQNAKRLIERDEDEQNDKNGQKLIEIFHLGDVFIDADDDDSIERTTRRFLQAFFGKTDITPSKDEFGCYMAKSASYRSADLSRQVGAAIFSEDGDLVSIGCNEVPKPGGGNYWYEDSHKQRDIDRQSEANREERIRIIYDLLSVLNTNQLLREEVTPDTIINNPEQRKKFDKSLVGHITEYGRMVHAEMNAIADAARLGRAVDECTMYVTTFPCHNCAKHIIASGISRVVFVEPYPKSKAELLYGYVLGEGDNREKQVAFQPFVGIAPNRFRDIFEKGERMNKDTLEVYEYYQNQCSPRVGEGEINYVENEKRVIEQYFPDTTENFGETEHLTNNVDVIDAEGDG